MLLSLGAEVDQRNIEDLFETFLNARIQTGGNCDGYFLDVRKDYTKTKLLESLPKLQITLNSGNYSCFILILGTHGQPKDVPTADIELGVGQRKKARITNTYRN